MATRMLRMATVSSQILMRHGKKDPPPQKRHMPIMRDGVRIEVGSLKNKKLLVYPDVDLAFIVSAIQKHGIEAGNWFYWFTTEESETDFCDNHCKGKSNLESARKWGLGRFVPYFGKDPTKMGEDADLKREYDRVYMILPELPDEKATADDHEKFVKELFLTTSPMLKENGVIKVFHLDSWDIEALAEKCDLECLVIEKFDKNTYPDFSPRRGGTDEKFDLTNCSVYTFRVLKKKQEPPLSETPPTGKKKDSKGKKKDSEGKQKDSKGKKKAHESATKQGLQLLLDIENVKKVVTSMDLPQLTEHKALVCAYPHRHEIIQELYTKSNDSKRGVIHGGLVRNGVSEGRFSKVMPCEIEKIQKTFNPQALIPVYSAMRHKIEKALADFTHPQPGEDSSPSIAAVAASIDWPQMTKYKGLVSAQPHRQEIIQDLYTTYNDPKRGIIHGGLIRAGVGEGQFKEVLLSEMEKIQKACILLEKNYMSPVTFTVFQKRQHAHFFPVRHGDIASTDRSGKIRPGTVVDTKICHPTAFDVYLCPPPTFRARSCKEGDQFQ